MFLAPLYAAGIAFGLVLILSSPLMIELLFDARHASKGISHLFEALYIWIGVGVIAGGYAILFAIAPATLTGVAKVLVDRLVILQKPRKYLIYGCAALASTLASFYFLFADRGFFSLDTSFWGRPAYSWVAIFVAMGLICTWLLLRHKSDSYCPIAEPIA
jgi:hypothetical protein